jgi:hypothetical protein
VLQASQQLVVEPVGGVAGVEAFVHHGGSAVHGRSGWQQGGEVKGQTTFRRHKAEDCNTKRLGRSCPGTAPSKGGTPLC